MNRKQREDELWSYVQYVMKGKPAFSIGSSGTKGARHVLTFGKSELNSYTGRPDDIVMNCNDCHYLDVSLTAVSNAYSFWKQVELTNNKIQPLNRTQFDDHGFDFFPKLNIDDGLWAGGTFDFVYEIQDIDQSMKYFTKNNVYDTVISTFSGCPDCNNHMSKNKYIDLLFKIILSSTASKKLKRAASVREIEVEKEHESDSDTEGSESKRRSGRPSSAPSQRNTREKGRDTKDVFSAESKMYYILLSGMLKKNDLLEMDGNLKTFSIDGGVQNYCYTVTDPNDQSTWSYRHIILWCLMKILIAAWEDKEINPGFRHHISYLYEGVQNFYLSLLYFVMHSANGENNISFEVFNFFYSSHFPFFLRSQHRNPDNFKSLSQLILKGTEFKFKDNSMDISAVRTQFSALKEKILTFWKNDFHHLSDFIHQKDGNDPEYLGFFCKPTQAASMSENCKSNELEIQSFKDFFISYPGYWFHFKNITMSLVERDCKQYFRKAKLPFIKRIWLNWYAHLCTCVNELGVDDRIRQSPLTAVFQQSLSPSRWRVTV